MKNGSLMVVCCVAVAWSAAADTAFDAVKASCRRQLGCGDERIREVVRFSEALIGEADAAKWSGCEWQKANDERAARLVATQRDDGSWPDVDYVNMTRSMFNAVRHLYNMRAIARSPRTPEKERALHKALAFWLDGGFQNPNWWWNKIGVPLPLGTVALLMDDILSAEERDRVVKALRVSKIYMTAQNRVWFAECVLYRALLEGNEADVKAAHAAILDELKISRTVEGIQTDWSFHQHGNQAQFGNYGASYISAMTRLLAIFDGTPWAVPDERRQVLEKLVVNGYMPIVWRGALDMGALGRRIGPGVDVRLPRSAHGFFGADAVAAVRMAGMCGRGGCELLADIGTNGEIALWRGDRHELTIASVAAGPAFERPGITGSQIIAALADALDGEVVDETGRVEGPLPGGLTQDDVRAVQLAKAAVKAGLDTLLAKTGVEYDAVTRFSLAGGFGSGLDVAKAARIGLFAKELQPVAVVCGNLAVEGAAAALFDPAFGDETDRIAHEAHHVELGGDPEFSDAFIEAIGFDE